LVSFDEQHVGALRGSSRKDILPSPLVRHVQGPGMMVFI
jgi:hypothetical protein